MQRDMHDGPVVAGYACAHVSQSVCAFFKVSCHTRES